MSNEEKFQKLNIEEVREVNGGLISVTVPLGPFFVGKIVQGIVGILSGRK